MLLIGLGHKARQGKDTAATELVSLFPPGVDAQRVAFADAVKREVRKALWNKQDHYWAFLARERNTRITAFLSSVLLPGSPAECWGWSGPKTEKGYGLFSGAPAERWRKWRAHRFMWEVILGNSPAAVLRHKCDNPGCVSPAHLEPGTAADNSADMVERGRAQYGEAHPNAYPDALIGEVREALRGGTSQSEVSRRFKLCTATVSRIANGKQRRPRPAAKPAQLAWGNDKRFSRAMLQHYGTEYRRASDPDYWVKRFAEELVYRSPDVALVTDVRFPNEADFIKAQGGVLVKVTRTTPPDVAVPEHESERALDGYAGWDYHLRAATVPELKQRVRELYAEIARKHVSLPRS